MNPRETAQLLVWSIDMVEPEEARRIADRETRIIEAAAEDE